jgi:hypothetical protein
MEYLFKIKMPHGAAFVKEKLESGDAHLKSFTGVEPFDFLLQAV